MKENKLHIAQIALSDIVPFRLKKFIPEFSIGLYLVIFALAFTSIGILTISAYSIWNYMPY